MDMYAASNTSKVFDVQPKLSSYQPSLLWKVNVPPGQYSMKVNSTDPRIAFLDYGSPTFQVTEGAADTKCLDSSSTSIMQSPSPTSTSPNPTQQSESKKALSAATIAGAVVGAVAAVSILVAVLFLVCRRKARKQQALLPNAPRITPYLDTPVIQKVDRKWKTNVHRGGDSTRDEGRNAVAGEGGGGVDRFEELWQQMQSINQRVAHIEVEQGPPEYMSRANVERNIP